MNLPKEIQNSVFFLKGKLKILSLEMIEKLIEEISNMCIDEIKDDIIKDHLKWTKMKNLKRL